MIIRKLKLHNFGVYAGENEFVFEGKKPIVLIGGMNGRGKTTFLEAVLLALYGSASFAYQESDHNSYSAYLRSFINRGGIEKECGVTIEFEICNGIVEEYIVKRTWDSDRKRTKEKMEVYKDGEYNEFLTNNWPLFIENVLPSALSSFFFFDGEKIAELAVDNTNAQLKNSIRSMLGISVLDILSSDIRRTMKKLRRNETQDHSSEDIQNLRDERDEAEKVLETVTANLENAKMKLVQDNDKLESLHHLYTAKGGDAVNKRQEMLVKRSDLIADYSKTEDALYTLVAEELPLLLVRDYISDIREQAENEHTGSVMRESVQRLYSIFADFARQYEGDKSAGKDFIEFVREKTEVHEIDEIYGLSERALFQVNNLQDGILDRTLDETRAQLIKKAKLEKSIGEIDSFLTLDINDTELQEIYNKIKKAEQSIISDQVKIAELEQKRSEANSRFNSINADFTKRVDVYLATAEVRDSAERITKYSNMALNVINKYQVELQKKKTDLLSATITRCYCSLANKKTLIQRIVMDPESLDWNCMSENGDIIPRGSLSAGEKQLLVISILWALTICAKQKLPVIIDTPLSRMDSLHRTALITTYFPNAGEQTIILSTDSEIDESYHRLMKENIGDEYTLVYDETTKSTSIKKGYLIGDKNDY